MEERVSEPLETTKCKKIPPSIQLPEKNATVLTLGVQPNEESGRLVIFRTIRFVSFKVTKLMAIHYRSKRKQE
jgi:hypothetical protein